MTEAFLECSGLACLESFGSGSSWLVDGPSLVEVPFDCESFGWSDVSSGLHGFGGSCFDGSYSDDDLDPDSWFFG